jgi:hypothetical protein
MNFIYDEKLLAEQAAVWDMPSFLQAYTLHDSSLLEIRVRPSADLLVLIDWDLHWNSTIPSQYNLLVIRFAMPYYKVRGINRHLEVQHRALFQKLSVSKC